MSESEQPQPELFENFSEQFSAPAGSDDAPELALALAVKAHGSAAQRAQRTLWARIRPDSMWSWAAWVISIVVHATLLAGAIYLYHHYRDRAASFAVALGNATEDRGGIFWRESSPGGGMSAELPDVKTGRPSQMSMTAAIGKIEKTADDDPKLFAPAPQDFGPQLPAAPIIGLGRSANSLTSMTVIQHRNPPTGGATAKPVAPAAPAPAPGGRGAGGGTGSGATAFHGDNGGGRRGVPAGAADNSLSAPIYPEESRRRGEEGVVKLAVEVFADGSIGSISVVSEPPYPRLTQSAIDAVKAAHFYPAIVDGRPIRSVLTVPFIFTLK